METQESKVLKISGEKSKHQEKNDTALRGGSVCGERQSGADEGQHVQ